MITDVRWPRIKEIFHSALDHPPGERSAFLNKVCGNDTAMREELEALLTADADNETFLSEPAYEFAAGMLSDEAREFSPGQEVGQYKIECFLGAGGMGQIYEAHDTKLGRKIALKFISPGFATDPRRVQRFEQEARAASALNHPNVCVIHDIGITDQGRHFIAMEFIVGSTLRDKMQGGFKPLETLQIITQVGDALASAHAKGIVHRDIKPENIMLRHDGFVKVVDFGLAKLTEMVPEHGRTGEVETRVHTEPHTIMGTVKYMSPEQLRETPVDEQTDIWSLGIVLYEMLTGVTPFDARTTNDSIALILGPQPPELQFGDEIPIQLREIVKKTLEKDCDQRYQTVTKLTADLRKLKRKLELNTEADFPSVSSIQSISYDRKKTARENGSAILTRFKSQARSTADNIFTEIRSHKRAAIFAGATSVLALLFFLPAAVRWINGIITPAKPVQQTMDRLTSEGKIICAAVSPDDKWVAYAEDQNGKQRLVVTNIVNSASFVAIPPHDVQYRSITFSRDNNWLYFTRVEKERGILYRLAWPGSYPIKLKEGVDSPISFSPQGDRFAFVRYDEPKTEFSLILSDIDGTNDQVISSRKNGATLSLYGVAWSPDGNMIVCPAGNRSKGWQTDLIAFDLKNGGERSIGNQSWFSIQQVAWQQDMYGLIISATPRLTSPHQLWRISFPEGDAQNLTTDLSEYTSVSLAGKRIVTVRTDRSWRIWVAALDNAQAMTEIARGNSLTYGLSWSTNGNIVFSSMTQDGLNIYRIKPDGSNQVQLTFAAKDNYMPASSADGRYILFASNRSGSSNIWRMNADDGSDPTQLTHGDADFYPSCSSDNQWVAYDNLGEWKASVWKVPMTGGEAIKVAENYRMPVFSPDSQFIAGRFDTVSGSRNVAIFPAQGGEPLTYFDVVPIQDWQSVKWIRDRREFSYVKNVDGYSNIWTYDLDTRTSKQITHFKSEQIYAYAWSPDFKQIACLRGTKNNNVVMISNSREH